MTRPRRAAPALTVALVALAALGALAPAAGRAGEGGEIPVKRAKGDYSPFPRPDSGYVTDTAGVLTAEEEERIERWLWQTESRTGVEIAVVVIESIKDYPGTPQGSIEQFATALFDKYGIGNMPRNNGVLLLVAVADRKARIELGAYYGHSSNAAAARIMDRTIVPRFRKGDYPGGITEGVRAIMLEFAELRVGLNWPLILMLVGIVVFALVAVSLFRSGKRGWGWVCVGVVLVLVLGVFFVVRKVLEHMPEGHSSGWSSGGFGGGFGGGFSGGGGATGSW